VGWNCIAYLRAIETKKEAPVPSESDPHRNLVGFIRRMPYHANAVGAGSYV
jgi:hypothetical protein